MFGIQQLKVENGSVMWNRLDMTSAVDWALKINYLSVMWTDSPFLWWWTSPVCTTRGDCATVVVSSSTGVLFCRCDWHRGGDVCGFQEEESGGRGTGSWTARDGKSLEEKLRGRSSLPSFTNQLQTHTYSSGLLSFFFWWKVLSIKLRLWNWYFWSAEYQISMFRVLTRPWEPPAWLGICYTG